MQDWCSWVVEPASIDCGDEHRENVWIEKVVDPLKKDSTEQLSVILVNEGPKRQCADDAIYFNDWWNVK